MTIEQIQTKLDLLRANLEQLEQIPQSSVDEFRSDFRNVQAALHLLQTSIQALIDLAGVLVSRLGLPTPRTSHDLFESLEEAGRLPPGTAARVGPIVGFRNRVVHLYDRIDEQRVFEIVTTHRADLLDLADALLAILEDVAPGA
jgi:uncharacterized protein YutE (UPF0331/DUF86 family)